MSLFRPPNHYITLCYVVELGEWVLFDDAEPLKKAPMRVSENGDILSFRDVSHRATVTSVVYVREQVDEGEQVSDKEKQAYEARFELDFKNECSTWEETRIRLKPFPKQLLEVIVEKVVEDKEEERRM
jgi:hypothetical protein